MNLDAYRTCALDIVARALPLDGQEMPRQKLYHAIMHLIDSACIEAKEERVEESDAYASRALAAEEKLRAICEALGIPVVFMHEVPGVNAPVETYPARSYVNELLGLSRQAAPAMPLVDEEIQRQLRRTAQLQSEAPGAID